MDRLALLTSIATKPPRGRRTSSGIKISSRSKAFWSWNMPPHDNAGSLYPEETS